MNWGIAILNVVLVLLLSPLYEGLIRKLKARIHSRMGPPITQPYLDVLKLLGKEELRSSNSCYFRLAPLLCLSAVLVTALLAPMGGRTPLGFAGDIIAFLYVASLAAVAIIIGAFAAGSPYASVGGSREMMMLLTVEPVMSVALITAAVKSHTLRFDQMVAHYAHHSWAISLAGAGLVFFIALQAQLGKLPFDIPEADQEIMEGPFMEYSGPSLALYRWSFFARSLIFASVLAQVFIPWAHFAGLPLGFNVLINLGWVLVIITLVGVIDSVVPRLRIDQSMNWFARVVCVALGVLLVALIGF